MNALSRTLLIPAGLALLLTAGGCDDQAGAESLGPVAPAGTTPVAATTRVAARSGDVATSDGVATGDTVTGAGGGAGDGAGDGVSAGDGGIAADAPNAGDVALPPYRRELLEMAFDAATAIPVDPHIKDRSKAQAKVVAACLDVDQPAMALAYAKRIDDWRRGECFADYAFYLARHGDSGEVQYYLYLAEQAATAPDLADWRRDRIRVKVARTHAWLGELERAAEIEAELGEAEIGKVDGVRAVFADEEQFIEQMEVLHAVVATGNLDLVRNALESAVKLFDRFYEDEVRRTYVEDGMKSAWDTVPPMIRFELYVDMTRIALDHGDRVKAVALIDEAQALIELHRWAPGVRVPMIADLAALRSRAGDDDRARRDVEAALALYEAERDVSLKVDRASYIRVVAEAQQAMGDTNKALATYARTIEEGADNANARPRALDLSATCASMAVHGVEPDAVLWSRLRELREGLDHPW